MKFLLTLIIAAAVTSVSFGQDTSYGAKISKDGAVAIEEALKTEASSNVKIKGEIITSCANKGCWMTMKAGNATEMRVTFKDYGFFVPTEGVEGKTAVLEGELKKVVTDVETLRHFAEDAGKSETEITAINEPKEEFTFIATGVIIQD